MSACGCFYPLSFAADLRLRGPPYAPVQAPGGERLYHTRVGQLVTDTGPLCFVVNRLPSLSPLCRITTGSHFLAPQQLFPTETAASPATPTQVNRFGARLAPDTVPSPSPPKPLTRRPPHLPGEVPKFGRNDSTSPAPPSSLAAAAAAQAPQVQSQAQAQAQPPQAQPQPQGQPQHHSSQQAFLPPGYSYTGLPYYAGVPGAVPSAAAFQYGPTMFVPPGGPGPASAKQHSLANPSASPFQQQAQQQPSGYGQHTFSSG